MLFKWEIGPTKRTRVELCSTADLIRIIARDTTLRELQRYQDHPEDFSWVAAEVDLTAAVIELDRRTHREIPIGVRLRARVQRAIAPVVASLRDMHETLRDEIVEIVTRVEARRDHEIRKSRPN
jgi:hypothetical protein